MARLKTGMQTGILDYHYQDILVGDTILDPGTGELLTVSPYGRFKNKKDEEKPRTNNYYQIVAHAEEKKGKPARPAAAGKAVKPVDKPVVPTAEPVVEHEETTREEVPPQPEMPENKPEIESGKNPLAAFSDTALADELRARGYSLKAEKTIRL